MVFMSATMLKILFLQAVIFLLAWCLAPRVRESFFDYWRRSVFWMMLGAGVASITVWDVLIARFAVSLTMLTIIAASILRFRAAQKSPSISG